MYKLERVALARVRLCPIVVARTHVRACVRAYVRTCGGQEQFVSRPTAANEATPPGPARPAPRFAVISRMAEFTARAKKRGIFPTKRATKRRAAKKSARKCAHTGSAIRRLFAHMNTDAFVTRRTPFSGVLFNGAFVVLASAQVPSVCK